MELLRLVSKGLSVDLCARHAGHAHGKVGHTNFGKCLLPRELKKLIGAFTAVAGRVLVLVESAHGPDTEATSYPAHLRCLDAPALSTNMVHSVGHNLAYLSNTFDDGAPQQAHAPRKPARHIVDAGSLTPLRMNAFLFVMGGRRSVSTARSVAGAVADACGDGAQQQAHALRQFARHGVDARSPTLLRMDALLLVCSICGVAALGVVDASITDGATIAACSYASLRGGGRIIAGGRSIAARLGRLAIFGWTFSNGVGATGRRYVGRCTHLRAGGVTALRA
mmetsp:Transcript_25503/g.71138  ORF Transcript_25503/g.71138 Transcript_25503/m.71138 type:complete len:280 (-) Transcript_25503:46-885(-)